ncbi:MAG: hypothetical protein ACTSX6_04640 [Candidatus Heimdallarchaeaceae archaeon]
MTELDNITREIKDLQRDMAVNIWKIGYRLNIVKDKKIYLDRYHTWTEYLNEEFDWSERSAQNFMLISTKLDEKTVTDYGFSKSRYLCMLDFKEVEEFKKSHPPETPAKEIYHDIKYKKARQIDQETEEAAEDIPDDDFKYYWDLETLGKNILSDIQSCIPKLTDFGHLFEQAVKMPSFKKYPRKQALFKLKHDIIREIGNLS